MISKSTWLSKIAGLFYFSCMAILGSFAVNADELSDANELFDLAESSYSKYFRPAGQATMELQGYLIRYYEDTESYLGVRDGNVYVYGSQFGPGIVRVGFVSDFITTTGPNDEQESPALIDLTDLLLTSRSANCAEYAGEFSSKVTDIKRNLSFSGTLSISANSSQCIFSSNNIPNHDFGEGGAFATAVSAQDSTFTVPAKPQFANVVSDLNLEWNSAILLNGVRVDMFAAACYGVADEKIGCNDIDQPWRFDPMSPNNNFGTDDHNAHTQPDGSYHYHGNPRALFDFSSAIVSPVVGFAADGFPLFGTYIDDNGTVRKVETSYRLKSGARPSGAGNPGGFYDGTYRDDYEFVEGLGDLDECNGAMVNGDYGYYITDDFPYMTNCFKGTPDTSFSKGGDGAGSGMPGMAPPPGN